MNDMDFLKGVCAALGCSDLLARAVTEMERRNASGEPSCIEWDRDKGKVSVRRVAAA